MNNYPENWPEIAERIKAKNNWKCERCRHPHEPKTGYVLTVHHLIKDKALCEDWNLASLCQRCHLRIQSKQVFPAFEQQVFSFFELADWLKPHYEGYLKWKKKSEQMMKAH